MGIIQLYLVETTEFAPICMNLFEPTDDVSQRSRTEEVLLFQSQFFASLGLIIRVKHTCDILGRLSFTDSSKVIAFIKLFQTKLIVRSRAPKSQVICVVSVVAWDRCIISLRNDKLAAQPFSLLLTSLLELSSVSTKPYCVNNIRSLNLPGIALFQPVIRYFNLLMVFNDLLKYTIVVPYTISPRWYLHSS